MFGLNVFKHESIFLSPDRALCIIQSTFWCLIMHDVSHKACKEAMYNFFIFESNSPA